MTIQELRTLLTACAGESDSVAMDGDILDTPFEALGYDSLALMETAARIAQEHGVKIPDDAISDLNTPRDVLDLVNQAA